MLPASLHGPIKVLRNAALVLYGPIQQFHKCCSQSCMGPGSYIKPATGSPVWAQRASRKVLPLSLYGHTQLSNICCRQPWMGPKSCLESSAVVFVWAHAAIQNMLPVVLYRARVLPKGWHCCFCMGLCSFIKPTARCSVWPGIVLLLSFY
jgi:hypothetical protein